MTTVAQAVAESGYTEPPDGDLCIARIEPGGKIFHATLRECAERDLATLSNTYLACGVFKRGSITVKGGRTRDNLIAVNEIPFDADLKDYMGRDAAKIHAMSDDEIKSYIDSLVADCQEVFHDLKLPLHRIVYSGYGVGLFMRVAETDRHRIEDIAHLNAQLVARINARFKSTLVDPGAKGAGERLMRLVGSFNRKGLIARGVYTYAQFPGEAAIDAFPVEPKPVQRMVAIRQHPVDDDAMRDIVLAANTDYTEGDRHGIALGLTAMLGKAGLPREQTRTVIETLAVHNDDPEVEDRCKAVDTTYDRLEAGLAISGYMRLRNHMSATTRDYIDARLTPFRHAAMSVADPEPKAAEEAKGRFTYALPPEGSFYGILRDYLQWVAPTTEASDAFHLGSFLTFAGIYIGRRAMSRLSEPHFPSLYTVLVGPSGDARKTTAVNKAATLFRNEERGPGGRVYEPSFATLLDLSTPEGLIQFMNDFNARTMVRVSEFDLVLQKGRREVGASLFPVLTRLWDCEDHYDLPTRKDRLRVEQPFLAMLCTTTPDALAGEMDRKHIGRGFANRALFFYGRGKGYIPQPPDPDPDEEVKIWTQIKYAVQSACGSFREFRLTPAAASLDSSWYHDIRTREYESEVDAVLAQRMQANARRMALIMAAVNGETAISQGAMEAAIGLADWEYAHKCAHAKAWGGSDDARLMEEVLDICSRKAVRIREIAETLGTHWGTAPLRVIEALIKMDRLRVSHDGYYSAA